MVHRIRPLVIVLVLSVVACDTLGEDGPVDVRVRNASDVTLDEGVLYLPGDSILISSLDPGTFTPYQEVQKAYRIASVWVVSGTDTAGLQVVDYVGEKALKPGKYTFVLAFFQDEHTRPSLELEKDR